jgi:hypothetical protein
VCVCESDQGIFKLSPLVIREFKGPRFQEEQFGEQRNVEFGHFEERTGYWWLD